VQLTTHQQAGVYASPWSVRQRVAMQLWDVWWAATCRWTPKPFNAWRLFWLRLFGARLEGRPFVHPRARITIPWNLTMEDRACLGDGAHAYCLGRIVLQNGCTVAQEAYLCSGTHDFSHPDRPLQTGPITVEAAAFVGARVFVLPGVVIGTGAVIGACSVVTRDVAPHTVNAGNPCRFIGPLESCLD
jgi:putative colanic acid biosynthesis acetyltransferase WcaF